jgi:glycogen debranching enzyme
VKYWSFILGRELAGYVPWKYNIPDNNSKNIVAWKHLLDTALLLGKYGLRTVEPSYRFYMKPYRYKAGETPECQWNGPSWPYQTAQVLSGMANVLNNYSQNVIRTSDYIKVLHIYAQQHYLSD